VGDFNNAPSKTAFSDDSAYSLNLLNRTDGLRPVNGNFNNIRLYDYTLTASEITAQYDSDKLNFQVGTNGYNFSSPIITKASGNITFSYGVAKFATATEAFAGKLILASYNGTALASVSIIDTPVAIEQANNSITTFNATIPYTAGLNYKCFWWKDLDNMSTHKSSVDTSQ
jgi:hypothetical protein